ncbi:MAG: hypothetical protein V5A61_10160 [Haloarculaceae archaeon]|jgi:hypothetical protein
MPIQLREREGDRRIVARNEGEGRTRFYYQKQNGSGGSWEDVRDVTKKPGLTYEVPKGMRNGTDEES